MKPSTYNYIFRVDGCNILVYNSLTTALAEVDSDEFLHLKDFFEDQSDDFFETRGLTKFKQQLIEMGFVVPNDQDEFEKIRNLRLLHQKQDRRLGLTIVPTLNCNFRCNYCFSYSNHKRMKPTTQQALLRFTEEKLQEAESLSISWFGGEPTLCMDIIENLSAGFADLRKKYKIPITPGTIVTNGYLLNEHIAKRLKEAGVARAQITLDGDRETHNRRRPLRGGKGTFDQILDNVVRTCDILDIQIRINIDKNNNDSALGVLSALESYNLQGKVATYFGHVKQFTDACADAASVCFTNREFSEHNLMFSKEAIARGFMSLPYPRLQIQGVCGADKPLSYVVAPDGLLFKCWAEASVGASWSVGSILENEIGAEQEKNLKDFLSWDPLATKQCIECSLLPICMGGCPHLKIRHNIDEDCSPWRYNLLDTLAIRYKLGNRIKSFGANVQT